MKILRRHTHRVKVYPDTKLTHYRVGRKVHAPSPGGHPGTRRVLSGYENDTTNPRGVKVRRMGGPGSPRTARQPGPRTGIPARSLRR